MQLVRVDWLRWMYKTLWRWSTRENTVWIRYWLWAENRN